MRQDLHLFIGDKEVEFNADPKILFNFKETELHNPTIVKNSWTKTININSTPNNDDIFNHYWNLERTQSGVHFNAMIKNPFTLYINSVLIQNGYCKLDSIKMSNHSIQYQISLFGGLGDFFYNLSYTQGQTDDSKKTLASLVYKEYWNIGDDPNLDFIINRNTVMEAWDAIMGTGSVIPDDKWKVINFAPVYNGIPADFDANKVLLNYRGINRGYFNINWNTDDSGNPTDWPSASHHYQPLYNGAQNYSGYSVAETTEELTCDETFDYRSYLQRPVVSVYRVLQACFHPENNGGYQVKLDSHFFNVNNPYYFNGWCTLPMLRDLEVTAGQTTEITGATIQSTTNKTKRINFTQSSLSQLDNVRMKVNVGLTTTFTGNTLYTYTDIKINDSSLFNDNYVKRWQQNTAVVMQLIAKDTNGEICGSSEAYCLSSSPDVPHYGGNMWDKFYIESQVYPKPAKYNFITGKWMKKNGSWVFTNMNGQQVDIEFSFNGATPISSLELLAEPYDVHYAKFTAGRRVGEGLGSTSAPRLWNTMGTTTSTRHTESQLKSDYSTRVTFTYNITEFYGVATDYEALFSDSYIPKDKLLSTSYSPAEFLISYCKMFGLYFYRDPAEVADNPTECPKGVIHIMDRNTFFTGEYVNLQDRIDRSRDMTITPTLAASKWYSFEQEPIESEAGDAYKNTYGQTYGRQVVNTGYNFDSNTTNLYDGSVFKSGVMVREKDKYFAMPYKNIPVYAFNGFKYTLYEPSTGGTIESFDLEIKPVVTNTEEINNSGLKGYDVMPKLQCHSDHNEATDGDGVLLFYEGYVQPRNTYWLTDDVLEMQTLNGGNACWLAPGLGIDAGGNNIALKLDYIPHFTRDLVLYGLQEGNILNSWNFGRPQVTFSPNMYSTEGDNIYDKCWRNYINDMYSVDGRKLTCYVNLQGIPTNAWLRRWYWFDNSIWRLNEIKDYNVADPATTQCEFIKVQDVDNYKLDEITPAGVETLTLSKYTVARTGETITGIVYLQAGGDWFSTDGSGVITGYDEDGNRYTSEGALRPYRGNGVTSNITVTFPASTAQTPITWNVCIEDGFDNVICKTVIQEGDNTSYIRFANVYQEMGPRGGILEAYYTDKRIDQDTITVNVEATGASSDPSWLTATLDKVGKRVTLSASTYTGPLTNRGARVTISGVGEDSNTYSSTMTVVQMSSSISISPTTLTFDYYADSSTANTKTIDIGSSEPITITLEDQQ